MKGAVGGMQDGVGVRPASLRQCRRASTHDAPAVEERARAWVRRAVN